MEFQTQAAVRDWQIVSVLKFAASTDAESTNATSQLEVIKRTGDAVYCNDYILLAPNVSGWMNDTRRVFWNLLKE